MKKTISTILFSAFLCVFGSAQITLTSANAPVVRTAHKTKAVDSLAASQMNVGAAGANQTWNFSTLKLNAAAPVVTTTYALTTGAPKASNFPTATLISREGLTNAKGVTYHRIGTADWVRLGEVDSALVSTIQTDIIFKYPVAFGSTYKDSVTIIEPDFGTPITTVDTVTVDAWGSIQTALGTFPALRVKRAIKIKLVLFGVAPATLNGTVYEWWTAQHSGPVLTHLKVIANVPDFGVINSLSYEGELLTAQTVANEEITEENHISKAYPSPAHAQISLDLDMPTAGNVSALMVSMNGQVLKTRSLGYVTSGKQSVTFDTSDVPNGTYQVFLMSDKNKLGVQKIVVAH
jgi:Secretion system C-terminal sorting domain